MNTFAKLFAGSATLVMVAGFYCGQQPASASILTMGSAPTNWNFNATASFNNSAWTNNADTASFNKSGSGLYVTVQNTNGQVGCYAMTFYQNNSGNWTFSGDTLNIDAGGITNTLSNASLTFSNNLNLTATQTWLMNNKSNPLKVWGNLSGSVTNLTFDSLNFGATLTLGGANTFTGVLAITNGGNLTLDYATMGQNNAKLNPLSPLYLGPGNVTLNGTASGFTEVVNGLALSPGGSGFTRSSGNTDSIQVGDIARTNFATLNIGASGLAATTLANNDAGILGCWAACAAGWAQASLGQVVESDGNKYNGNAADWIGTDNVNINASTNYYPITNSVAINALRFGMGVSSVTIDLSGGTLTFNGGGLMSAPPSVPVITNGYLQSGLTSGEIFIWANGRDITNFATIVNNGTTNAVLVKEGGNNLTLAGSNNYSGGTYVNRGALIIPNGGNISAGPLYVGTASTLTFNRTDAFNLTNAFSGGGTVQNVNSGTMNLYMTNSSGYRGLIQNTSNGVVHLFALGGNNTVGAINNKTKNIFILDGTTGSTNIITSPTSTGSLNCNSGGTLRVDGGTWIHQSILQTFDLSPGAGSTLIINGGTLVAAGGASGFNATNFTVNSGEFDLNSGRLSFNLDNQTLNINGGQLVCNAAIGLRFGNQNGTANQAGNVNNFTAIQTNGTLLFNVGNIDMGGNGSVSKTASYTLAGGSVLIQTNGTGGYLALGADTAGLYTNIFTITNRGKLVVSGIISGKQGSSAKQAFSFKGGTLVAGTVDTSQLRDTVANPFGTLVNSGGTLAPGDLGKAGKTTILGNYTVSSGSAALAIDIGGTNQASAFSNGSGYYDTVFVTTNVSLNGSLNVNLINGFTPAATQSFAVLMSTNVAIANVSGSISGTFNNLLSGERVAVNGDTNVTFNVVISANAVVLTNYQSAVSSAVAPTNVVATLVNISGTNYVVITGTGGSGSSGYTILTTTNLATPLASWTTNATGVTFGLGGSVNYTNAVNPGNPEIFYRLRVP